MTAKRKRKHFYQNQKRNNRNENAKPSIDENSAFSFRWALPERKCLVYVICRSFFCDYSERLRSSWLSALPPRRESRSAYPCRARRCTARPVRVTAPAMWHHASDDADWWPLWRDIAQLQQSIYTSSIRGTINTLPLADPIERVHARTFKNIIIIRARG